MMRRLLLLLVATGVLLAVVGGLAFVRWQEVTEESYRGWAGEELILEVPPGSTGLEIYALLEKEGLVRDAEIARLVHRFELEGAPLKAGEYEFEGPATVAEVLDKLARGRSRQYPVTIREGLDRWEVAEIVGAAYEWIEADEVLRATADPGLIVDLDPIAPDLEGYLFPETYSFSRGTPAAEIVERLVSTFRNEYEQAVASVGGTDRNVREVVAVASIVETEAAVEEERPRIAAVYLNRIERGMLLQADPTVIYALKLAGTWDGNIRRRDLKLDSPYNTYVTPGLPPGPISNPGRRSIEAVLAPASTRELYFVSRNDGTHVFSETYAAHQRAVEKWQKAYWRKKWAEERRRK